MTVLNNLIRSPGYIAALTKSKVKMSEKSENFGHETDGSVSDSQSWGVISIDGQGESDAVNEIKEPPTVTHPVFREFTCLLLIIPWY